MYSTIRDPEQSDTPKAPEASCPITADLHTHTHHSHGQASVEDMYRAGRARQLSIIGFSEHSPRPEGYTYPADYQEKLLDEFPLYLRDVNELTRTAKDEGVTVLLGLEMDYIPAREAFARQFCSAHDFDYVIGGLHFQDTWGFDSSADDWVALSRKERFAAYARYYQDLASMCRTGLFHIAAHPDLIKLFTIKSFHCWLDTPEASGLIEQALLAMKDNGMAMEVSSAGLRKPCKEIYPCRHIMRMAAALQVSISFGSDAHCTGTPAFAFDTLARYACEYGYTQSLVFERGKSRFLPFSTAAIG